MLLTFKIKHNRDFSDELRRARLVAEFAVKNRDKLSSKYVKHLGLKSTIASQILRKYGNDKKCKSIRRVSLIVPGQGCKLGRENKTLWISSLKLKLRCWFDVSRIVKVNQIELDREFAFVTVTVTEEPMEEAIGFIGIDLNATGHCVVVADPSTGRVKKLARQVQHVKKTYRDLRAAAQSNGDFRLVKKLGRRESAKTNDVLHRASNQVVQEAKKLNKGIRFEDLTGIRKRSKKGLRGKRANFTVNSWPFHLFRAMVEYKAKLHGVRVEAVDPSYTSQRCSRCSHVDPENRDKKQFVCKECAHVDHADANAAFNIAVAPMSVINPTSKVPRRKGRKKLAIISSSEVPKGRLGEGSETLEPHPVG